MFEIIFKSKIRKHKKRKSRKESLYLILALLVIVFSIVFIYKTTVKIVEEEKPVQIDLNRYKEATFSDSFSGDGWIDTDKTTLVFKKEEAIFIYPEKETLMGSLAEPGETEEETKQIVSLKVNFAVNKIAAAQITRSDNEIINGRIKYYFSNDDGLNWEKAEMGQTTYFKNSGNNLKWKAEIGPLDQKGSSSIAGSFISSIYVKYWYER